MLLPDPEPSRPVDLQHARFRVNGPLSNIPAFARAFGCKAGDPMIRPPNDRCQIW
jgi:endothelin-converting enzyme/putative endopeptidase